MRHFTPALLLLLSWLGGADLLIAQEVESLTALQVTRTERLLENRVACRGCHVIAGRGGAIGPMLDGIRDRADRTYVVSVIRDPGGIIPGTIMPHQPMPDAEAERLTDYLLAHAASRAPATAAEAPAALGPDQSNDGAALYTRHCAACHGAEGGGDGWNAPNLPVPPTPHADANLMSQRADDTLFDGIAVGGYVLDKSARMPAFGSMLTAVQIRALIAHIRRLCDCEQPEWAKGGD
jgi:mono/diheme cytochrome c family protein